MNRERLAQLRNAFPAVAALDGEPATPDLCPLHEVRQRVLGGHGHELIHPSTQCCPIPQEKCGQRRPVHGRRERQGVRGPTRQLDRFGAPKSGLVEIAEQQQVRAHEGQECGVRLDDEGRRLTHGFLWRGEASQPPLEVPLSGDKAAQLLESPSNAPLTLDVNGRNPRCGGQGGRCRAPTRRAARLSDRR